MPYINMPYFLLMHSLQTLDINQVIDKLQIIHLQNEGLEASPMVDPRAAWENGCPDYTGRDKFDNIQTRLDEATEGEDRDPQDVPVLIQITIIKAKIKYGL